MLSHLMLRKLVTLAPKLRPSMVKASMSPSLISSRLASSLSTDTSPGPASHFPATSLLSIGRVAVVVKLSSRSTPSRPLLAPSPTASPAIWVSLPRTMG